MAVPREIRQRIEKGDLDAVESAWLERVEEAPEDLDWFVGIGRHLASSGHAEAARTLLEMLADELRARASARLRLDLLRAIGEVLVPKTRFHDTVLEALREVWGEHPSFESGLASFGLLRSGREPAEVWDRVGRMESVLRYIPGTIVWVEGHGAGRVVEVNLELESLKIGLETGVDLRVGFRAAGKLLEQLDPNHFMVQKMERPEPLQELSPAELLARLLQSFSRPLTVAEIRGAVDGLVPKERWSTWWSSARKHPQVVASPTVRNAYVWADSNEEASAVLWRQFETAAPLARVDLLRKVDAGDDAQRRRMIEDLQRIAREVADSEPGLALEIALALEKTAPDSEPGPGALIAAATGPERLLTGVASKPARARAYELARELRPDWQRVYAAAAQLETDPTLLTQIYETLAAAEPEAAARLAERALGQPTEAPALFTWVAERAGSDEAVRGSSVLRLWKRILYALGRDELQPYRKRLIALAESGGTLPRLLSSLTDEEAAEALEALRKPSGMSDDRRRPLEDAIMLRFPALRETEEPLYALESSIRDKREELRKLLEDEIPRNRRAIEEARALGDLRENFEYKSARQRHEYLAARAGALSKELARSKAIDLERLDLSRAGIGTAALLRAADGEELRLALLGPWESAPEAGVLSYLSEVGRELLGKLPGEEVAVAGKRYSLVSVEPAAQPEPAV